MVHSNQVVVFKVEYKTQLVPEYNPISFALLNLDSLMKFKIYSDTSNITPNIIFNITGNGGLYISESGTDIATFGCCEFGSVDSAFKLNFQNKITDKELVGYSIDNKSTTDAFNLEKGKKLTIKKGARIYNITFWLADLTYCKCNGFMESYKQCVKGDKVAYIKRINNISFPKRKLSNRIIQILNEIVKYDN